MKAIHAYIMPHKLDAVIEKLHQTDGLTGVSVLEVKGFGRGRGLENHEHIVEDYEQIPHLKLEIVCHDYLVDQLVAIIEKAAHTGLRGDGKIYVLNVENAVRISTGERGEKAV